LQLIEKTKEQSHDFVQREKQTGKSKSFGQLWQDRFAATLRRRLHGQTRPLRITPLGSEVVRRVLALTLRVRSARERTGAPT
jgi:hypothetical protein